jgi:hypothetical protein
MCDAMAARVLGQALVIRRHHIKRLVRRVQDGRSGSLDGIGLMRLECADSLQHGVLQVTKELNVATRVPPAYRRDPPEVLSGEQLFLDRRDGTTDQCDLRAGHDGGEVGVETGLT